MNAYNSDMETELEVAEEMGEYDNNRDFITLEAWKKAKEVQLFFYQKVLFLLPAEEKFNLKIQIMKSAVSITANIAEGYGRYHYQEGMQFYRISRASLYELKDHLISCLDFNYVEKELFNEGTDLIEIAKRTLNGYINYVSNQIQILKKGKQV